MLARAAGGGDGAGGRPPLVVVGSVNADLVLTVDRVPAPGETLGASSLAFFPGGKGANQAAAAARLGYPTYFIGERHWEQRDPFRFDRRCQQAKSRNENGAPLHRGPAQVRPARTPAPRSCARRWRAAASGWTTLARQRGRPGPP